MHKKVLPFLLGSQKAMASVVSRIPARLARTCGWSGSAKEQYFGGSLLQPSEKQQPAFLEVCPVSSHACLVKRGLLSFTSVANSILSFYFRRREVDAAVRVFHAMGAGCRDSVSWNIVVHGFLGAGCFPLGLHWFRLARGFHSFEPNVSTLVLVLVACFELGSRDTAGMLHGYLTKSGFLTALSIQNSLLRCYPAGGACAEKLFDEMLRRDVVSWSVMIGGYVKSDDAAAALAMFKEMVSQAGIEPDGVVLVTVLNASTKVRDLRTGTSLHGLALRRGLDQDLFVQNSLIDAYSKGGEVGAGFKVFDGMPLRNHVSWNSMLSGLVQNEEFRGALTLVRRMPEAGMEADDVTLVNILQLSKRFGHSGRGWRRRWTKLVHCFAIRRGCDRNELIQSSLVDAYGSCGQVEVAWQVFAGMERRDVVSWSAMVAGFARCGMPEEAIAVFREMCARAVAPNAITITSLLEACAVSAQPRRCRWGHGIAARWGLAGEVGVGTAVVDMYSKCGEIGASWKAFERMPCKNVVTWSAMIAGCAANGLAREAVELVGRMRLAGFRPNSVTMLSALAGCSRGGLVGEGLELLRGMAEAGPEHYSCVVDMLGRAGMVGSALQLVERVPGSPSAWGAVLSACTRYGSER